MIRLKWANNVIIVLCFVSILLLSYNAFYKTDDYGYMNDIKKIGVIQNCFHGYFTWDGRFLSLASFAQGFMLRFFSIQFVFLFWSLCFLISGFLIKNIIQSEKEFLLLKFNFHTGLLLSVIFWFISLPILNEVVYWGVGGGYSFALLLGAIWVLLYLRANVLTKTSYKFIFFVFTFLVGASTQNLTIPLLVLVIITIIILRLQKNKNQLYFHFFVICFLFLGLCFIQFAPGNLVRLQALGVKTFDLSVLQLLKNVAFLLFVNFKRLYLLFCLSIILGILFLFYWKKIKISLFLKKTSFIEFLVFFKWALVAISSILPFVLIPSLASLRTSIYFNFFMLLFFVSTFCKVLVYLDTHENVFITNLISVFLSTGVFVISIYYFNKGLVLKQEIEKRESLLLASEGKTVNVKLIDPKLNSFIYTYIDFGYPETPQNSWIKISQEVYFNVKINVVK